MSLLSFSRLTGWLAMTLLPVAPVVASAWNPADMSPSGWIGSKIDSVFATYQIRGTARNETLVAAAANDQIVLLNAANGTVRSVIQKPTDYVPGPYNYLGQTLGFDGDRLLVASLSGFRAVRLDELDALTGTWVRSSILPYSGSSLEIGKPTVIGGEIRIHAGGGILRWNRADLAGLATITPGNAPFYLAQNPAPFGNRCFVGFSMEGQPYLEENGSFLPLNLPVGYKTAQYEAAGSGDYFAIAVTETDGTGDQSWMVWRPGSGPIVIPAPDDLYSPVIWKNRYLTYLSRDHSSGTPDLWMCQDLQNPSQAPIAFPLPSTFDGVQVGSPDSGPWIFDNMARRTNQIGTLIHLPLQAASQTVKVTVEGATVNERDGQLIFRVSAFPAPTVPVTVELATQSGSAIEGSDFTGWSGTVTLTPSQPTVEIPIRVIQDLEVESAESFLLEVRNISEGWCAERLAKGVIVGSGFPPLAALPPLPGTVPETEAYVRVRMTDAGVVAFSPLNRTKLYFARNGQQTWSEVSAFVPYEHEAYQGVDLLGSSGNLVFLRGPLTDSGMSDARSLIKVIDVNTNTLVRTFDVQLGSYATGFSAGALLLSEGYTGTDIRAHDLATGQTRWSTPSQKPLNVIPTLPGGFWLRPGSSFFAPLSLARMSDGTEIRVLKTPLDAISRDLVAVSSSEGITAVEGEESILLHRLAPDQTDLYLPVAEGRYFLMAGGGVGFAPSGDYGVRTASAIDAETGAMLATIDGSPTSWAGGILAGPAAQNRVARFSTAPKVPAPRDALLTRSENLSGIPLTIEFTEPAGFPVTVRVVATSSPDDVTYTNIPQQLPVGTTALTLPASVVDDGLAEDDEEIAITIECSGNGHSALYDLRILIRDNDTWAIPSSGEGVVSAASIVVTGNSGVIGRASNVRAALDFPSGKIYYPVANEQNMFGHSVAANDAVAAVGCPGYAGVWSVASVYLYNRSTGAKIAQIGSYGGTSGYAAALAMNATQLFAAAPGFNAAGAVYSYNLPGGAASRTYTQPGAPSAQNRFGTTLATSATKLWVGAPGVGKGAVYQFNLANGALDRTFTAPAEAKANFGQAVTVSGNTIAIGSPSAEGSSVFLYALANGAPLGRMTSPAAAPFLFGTSLAALDSGLVAIGTPGPSAYGGGYVFLYDFQTTPPRSVVRLSVGAGESSTGPLLYNLGQTNSLSASGTRLGLVSQNSDPLVPLDPASTRGGAATLLDLSDYVSFQSWQSTAPAGRKDLWHYALGGNHTAADRSVSIVRDGKRQGVKLPAIDAVHGGSVLLVEHSEDLVHWSPLAYLDGSMEEGWQKASSSASLDSARRTIWLENGRTRGFTRVRCVASR